MPPFRAAFLLATAGAAIVTVDACLRGPPSLPVALALFTAYGALITSGVLFLRLRVFVDALLRGPKGEPHVALTFDDGPDPESTRRILAVLAERSAKATFFLIAKKAEKHPALVRELLDQGHEVGLHAYGHDRLFSLRGERAVRDDLTRGVETLERLCGVRPVWFRPPIGHTNPIIARVAEDLDLAVIGWSASARDGTRGAKLEACLGRIKRGLAPGAVLLLHDASERGDYEPLGAELLRAVLDEIEQRKLTVVPLSRFVPIERTAGP